MTYENLGDGALDYFPCRYLDSKLRFRGPRKPLEDDYIAFLGGTETYGRFLEVPFPELVSEKFGWNTVNLGCVNAGPDAYLNELAALDIANNAQAVVIEITGAQNCSNRFYTVHPRRNDRFVQASSLMQTIFGDVDFTEFHFTKHLIETLRVQSPDRVAMLLRELKEAWVARMTQLLGKIERPVILLWMSDRPPVEDGLALGSDPWLIDRQMINALREEEVDYLEVVKDPGPLRTDGMVFSPLEAPAAGELLGIDAHHTVARALEKPLKMVM